MQKDFNYFMTFGFVIPTTRKKEILKESVKENFPRNA